MKRGAPWPVAIVAFLVAGASANVYLLVRASSDPAFSVEPDYYAKAIAWDAHLAQMAHNEALGWKAALSTDEGGIVVRLEDRDGRPVAGAAVTLEAFPMARGNQIVRGSLGETPEHAYRADLSFARAGLWEFRLAAQRGADTFTAILDQDVR